MNIPPDEPIFNILFNTLQGFYSIIYAFELLVKCFARCPRIITPKRIIKRSANITRNYGGIREIAPTDSVWKNFENHLNHKIH